MKKLKGKVKLIIEEERKVGGIEFDNTTRDQFPYVESALNILDNNFDWWRKNWETLEEMIALYLKKEDLKDNVRISSRFTVFHGIDEKTPDVIWSGPVISYSINGATPQQVKNIKDDFGGIYHGRKMFAHENQLIFLFG